MKVSSENYQNTLSVNSEVEQAATASKTGKGAENTQNANSSSSADTVAISGQAAKLAHAEMREQAALARIQMLKEQNAAVTQSDEQAENGDTLSEDPLTRFINTMFKMLEERQETQLENAAEQAERQEEEMDAAMRELADARAEKKAVQGDAVLTTDATVFPKTAASAEKSAESNSAANSGESSSSRVLQKGQEQSTAAYGKKGVPVRTGSADTGNKSGYRATA